jgi:hypothetical protein
MANPQTCRHNIVVVPEEAPTVSHPLVVCGSCGIDLSKLDYMTGRLYEWDVKHSVWAYVSPMKAKFLRESKKPDVRSEDIFKEASLPDEIIVKDPKYNDGEWFIDIQDGEEQVWEVQYNMDLNEHVWVPIFHRSIWKPRGRQIERPTDQELGLRE